MTKRSLIIDLNLYEPPWSPNVDVEGIDEWRRHVMDGLIYEISTISEITKPMEQFEANAIDSDDRMFRRSLLGNRYENLMERKNTALIALLDMGPILL